MTMLIRIFAVVLLTALAFPLAAPPATAQQAAATEEAAPDYAAWEKVARRAEGVLGAGRASDAALSELRQELVDWRTRLLNAQGTNAARIKTLREQIAALGAAPAEGETEPDEIAKRRAELNKQLADLQAPGLQAVEAHSRADGLIREIDSVIRERQTSKLLELGPTPLNPVNWAAGAEALRETGTAMFRELAEAWATPSRRAGFREDLPVTILFLGMAAVLLARGPRWVVLLSERLILGRLNRGGVVFSSLVSLGQIVVPTVGLVLLVAALASTGLGGERLAQLLTVLPVLGLSFFTARWLGSRVFAAHSVSRKLFDLPPERMAEARFHATGMGLVIALAGLLGLMGEVGSFADEAKVVLGFPLVVAGGLLLIRMGQILHAQSRVASEGDQQRPYRNRLIGLFGRAAVGFGVTGPVLGAIGYKEAADFFIYPPILTLGLLGLLMVVQRFVGDLYDLISGRDTGEGAADALLPVLIGLMLAVMALPVLALIWGARVADLTEIWARFTAGFTLGATRISPADFLTFAIVFTLGYALTRLVQGTLRTTVLPKTRIDPGGQTAIISGLGYVGIFLAALIAITTAGIDLSSLAIVAGALSVGIGFGLRTIVENFVSGIILLIERPISQGDWIEVGGVQGIVQDISVRSTRIQTFDRTDVIVPNADLVAGQVTNWTRQNLTGRVILTVGVAYGTDTRKVERILREIGESHPLVMIKPPPSVVFQGFGADALEFELRVILRDINYGLSVRTELNHEIARRFAEEGIEIPFAQRDIWLRNPEALRTAGSPVTAPAIPPAQSSPPPPRQQDDPQPEPRDDLGGEPDDADGDASR
ncbi:DUF3772 domain-containing protein [Rhodovulum euryhalinum]|uniref:Small-conductance mechanosensitive channel n=1 Tax=Rhodovulum euryhalinum TaxID=35805 RepID=A0A4R2KJ59_9RHOB|nr:DUF3772 domain-containing protein [Rhodovulum euryhalinum]TCO70629.1 small-conductance mechanosensitive channel [Rhodovulum euryhalinum]